MAEEKVFSEYDRPENLEGEFVIPDGFTMIEESAFRGCSGLTSVVIPNSVTEIGDEAFVNCSNLTRVVIPDSVTAIGYGNTVFEGCEKLTDIVISENSKFYFEAGVLYDKENNSIIGSTCPTNVVVPDSVTKIGFAAFRGCKTLTHITIPNTVTKIEWDAFENCPFLAEIEIPDSISEIGDRTFCCCTSLASVKLPNTLNKIGESAFECCESLTSIVIPDSVTKIGCGAFSDCDNLQTATIPAGVKYDKYDVFGENEMVVISEESTSNACDNSSDSITKMRISVLALTRSFYSNYALQGKMLGKNFDFLSKEWSLSNAEKHRRINRGDFYDGDEEAERSATLKFISVADESNFSISVEDSQGNKIYKTDDSKSALSHVINSESIAEDIIWDFGYDPHSEDILFFSDFSDLEFIKNFLPASMCSADVLEFVSKAMCEYAEERDIDIDSDEVTCEEALTLLTYAVELLFAKQNSSLLTLSALIDCPGVAMFETQKGNCYEFDLELPNGENFDPSKLKLFKFYKEDMSSSSQGIVDESYDGFNIVQSFVIYGDTLLEGESDEDYSPYGQDLVDIDSEGVFTYIPYEYEEEDDDEETDSSNDHIAFFNSFKSAVDFGDKLKVNKPSKNEVGITCSEMGKIKLVSKRTKNDLCVIAYSYDEKERMERIHSSKNAEIESALSSFGELGYTATDKSAAFSIKKPLSDFADDDARFEWIKNVALTFRDLFVKYVAM